MIHRSPSRRGGLLLGAAIVLSAVVVACTEDLPTNPKAAAPAPTGADIAKSSIVSIVKCTAKTAPAAIECDYPDIVNPKGVSAKPSILIGGQDQFVAVKSQNANYDAGSGAFTFDVTVRNLMPQPLGTADTTGANTPDVEGVRVLFSSGPTVTGGSGTINVVGDGTADFGTGTPVPFYRYSTVLPQFSVTSPKTWTLSMPSSVTSFEFFLLVSAAVPREAGYIDLQGNLVRPPADKQISATERNANGTIAGTGTITWWVSDTTRATIDQNGLLNPLRAGSVVVYAQDGGRIGKLVVTVKPIRRIWTGAAGTTDYETNANWWPDSIKPVAQDTAVVADTVSIFPVLTANESIGGVEVLDITPGGTVPTLGLAAFNYDASGDVLTTNSGAINNTSGSLILSGIGRTVGGTVPFLRVTGTYSLISNVIARAPIRVDLGRLTNSLLRIQGTSF